MSFDEPVEPSPKTEHSALTPATARQQQSDVVYHRSPTLLASATGGSPEGVQVWAPNTLTLFTDAGLVGSLVLIFLPFILLLSGLFISLAISYPSVLNLFVAVVLVALDVQIFLMIRGLPYMWSRGYVTTDASGIAIQRRKRETRAILWKDIQSLTVGEKKISLFHPEPTVIGLWGYHSETSKRLLSLIMQRTQLVPAGKGSSALVKSTQSNQQAASGNGSMLWQRFTEKAKQAVITAQNEAMRYGSPTVEPEHLLLAILDDDNIAASCLTTLGVSPQQVSQELRAQLKESPQSCGINEIQLGKRTKKVLDGAYTEAKQQRKDCLATVQLLSGILRTRQGMAYDLLAQHGITVEAIRQTAQSIEETNPPVTVSHSDLK